MGEPILEDDEGVKKLANESGAVLLAFVAPYAGIRVSPVSAAFASIGLEEEFGIESFIDLVPPRLSNRLYLMINSPGGGMTSSYKVARALRKKFKEIITFVPHVAASGGTLMALAGNKVVMGPMSNLTPLDAQINYNGVPISTNNFIKSYQRIQKSFEKLLPEEAPYPQRAMAEKLDPLIMEEMNGIISTGCNYVAEVLTMSGYNEESVDKIVRYLILECNTHSTVLTREHLSSVGIKIEPESKFPKEWRVIRNWLKKHVHTPAPVHHLFYRLPEEHLAGKNKAGTTRKKERAK